LPMAFFGAFAPHERFQGRRLEGADEEVFDSIDVFEEKDVYGFYEVDEEADDNEFSELIEYLDNQWW